MNDGSHIALSVEEVELSFARVDMLGTSWCDRRPSFEDAGDGLACRDEKDVVDFMRERV